MRRLMILTTALLLLAAPAAFAQRGDDSERASKNGAVEGQVDGVGVALEFGRPNVKGREIWGGLVPYGSVWRTGADEATTITFGADVEVEGQPLAAGTYSLFTIPGESEWTVIFNNTAKQWGTYNYDAGEDVLRVTVTPEAAEHEESMNFELTDGAVVLRWEKLAVPIKVESGA